MNGNNKARPAEGPGAQNISTTGKIMPQATFEVNIKNPRAVDDAELAEMERAAEKAWDAEMDEKAWDAEMDALAAQETAFQAEVRALIKTRLESRISYEAYCEMYADICERHGRRHYTRLDAARDILNARQARRGAQAVGA